MKSYRKLKTKPDMEKWQTQLSLRFPGIPWRIRVGFDYEWKAWLIAYDLKGMEPEDFSKLPIDQQMDALAYGAAAWHCMKKGKKVFFTPDNMTKALMRASKQENLLLAEAMTYAQFPAWLKANDDAKKKEQT